jgi:putative transcriptional regulator
MTIRHRPDDDTLVAYEAGAMREGMSLVVASHQDLCPLCRGLVREANGLGRALLGGLEAAPLSDGTLAAVLARIDAGSGAEPESVPQRRPRTIGGLPATLLPWLPVGLERVPWRALVPGIEHFRFPGLDSGEGAVRRLASAPGRTLPHHGHGGTDLTLILRCSFADDVGRFLPGDLADLDPPIQHQPVADTDMACICPIATDARLLFSGVLNRLFQPLVGL